MTSFGQRLKGNLLIAHDVPIIQLLQYCIFFDYIVKSSCITYFCLTSKVNDNNTKM